MKINVPEIFPCWQHCSEIAKNADATEASIQYQYQYLQSFADEGVWNGECYMNVGPGWNSG